MAINASVYIDSHIDNINERKKVMRKKMSKWNDEKERDPWNGFDTQ